MAETNLQPSIWRRLGILFKREVKRASHRPLFLFCLLIAPMFFTVMYVSLMRDCTPTDLPCGLVNEDGSAITNTIVQTLDAMQETDIVKRYPTFSEAREAVQRGEIYGIFHIPSSTTQEALASRQPKVYFYTNDAYYLAGAFLFKNMKLIGELSGLAITRETLRGKGLNDDQIMALIMPISIETHAIHNSTINYAFYLINMVMPGILLLMVFLSTTYSIGLEWKQGTHKEWFTKSGRVVTVALIGKLLPQTLIFMLDFLFMDAYLYGISHFPIYCSIGTLALIQLLTVVAAQAIGVCFFGMFAGQVRLAMSAASLVGVLSISLCGFTFPVMGMPLLMKALSYLLPLRHYFLLYVNQVLNGFSIQYAWTSIAALLAMMLLPLLFVKVYKNAFDNAQYKE